MSKNTIVDNYRVDDYREKKGKGLIRLLSELQWVYNAELDNDCPYETDRILFKKRVYLMGLGSSFALTVHFAVSFTAFISALGASALSPVLGELISVLGMIWKVAIISAFPLYVIKKFHLWNKGITRLLLQWTVVYGYLTTIVFMSLLFGLFSVVAFGGISFLSVEFPAVKTIALWTAKHVPFLISPYGLLEYPAELSVVFFCLYYLHKLDKKHSFEEKPYSLLDKVPEE